MLEIIIVIAVDLIFKNSFSCFISSFSSIAQIYSATTDDKSHFTALSFVFILRTNLSKYES